MTPVTIFVRKSINKPRPTKVNPIINTLEPLIFPVTVGLPFVLCIIGSISLSIMVIHHKKLIVELLKLFLVLVLESSNSIKCLFNRLQNLRFVRERMDGE